MSDFVEVSLDSSVTQEAASDSSRAGSTPEEINIADRRDENSRSQDSLDAEQLNNNRSRTLIYRLNEKDREIRTMNNKLTKAECEIAVLRLKLRNFESLEEEKKALKDSLDSLSMKYDLLTKEDSKHLAKISELQAEIKFLKSDVDRLRTENDRVRGEKLQLSKEHKDEWEKAMRVQAETAMLKSELIKKKISEFEDALQNIRLDYNAKIDALNSSIKECVDKQLKKRIEHDQESARCEYKAKIDELNRTVQKHVEDKFRMREEHSKEIQDLRSENRGARLLERMQDIVKNQTEKLKLRCDEALAANCKKTCDLLLAVYGEFNMVAEELAALTLEARKGEKAYS